MPILATLRKENFGSWASLDEYYQALRRREAGAIGALNSALGAEPSEQKELGQGEGAQYMVDLASDLRVQKGARLAAVRSAMEAGLDEVLLSALFLGAGDLVTDPRLGAHARRLSETGLTATLARDEKSRRVSTEAGAFARACHTAASVLGPARLKELLAAAPPGHAGAHAALFVLGGELPAGDRQAWQKYLTEQCIAHRKAPAAAKRMGLAPPWPPFLPEPFAPLVKEAEEGAAGVNTTDVLAKVSAPQGPVAPLPAPGEKVVPPGQPLSRATSTLVGTRTLAPPIQARRRSTGVLVEGTPDKPLPRTMPAVLPQKPETPGAPPPAPAAEAPPAPPSVAANQPQVLPSGATYAGKDPLRFDPRGRRIPRADRWSDDAPEWADPILPPSKLKDPGRVRPAPGPFGPRLKSLFEDRPEAIDRLCGAADARAARAGLDGALDELRAEALHPRWKARTAPAAQLQRLASLAGDADRPAVWRGAAELLLELLGRERS